MKILIVGGDGMLGHQLLETLKDRHEVRVTLRQNENSYHQWNMFNPQNSFYNIDVAHIDDLHKVLLSFKPQAVINAVGIVKQRKSAKEAIPSIEINALFPHKLALLCEEINARMIHISTDCVFSGRQGKYRETDLSDAEDLYGKSKFLGEVHEKHCVTIRSSIIGLELSRKTSLIEWFLAQHGTIKGFKKAIYTGITTQEMSRLIERILLQHPDLSGLWHVASDEINKFDLLKLFSKYLNRQDINIEPDENFVCDRSMNGTTFTQVTGYRAPSWDSMLKELAEQVKQREAMTCNA